MEVVFEPRYAIGPARNPGQAWLRELILDPSHPGREWGEALITFRDAHRTSELIVINDRDLGHYLKYEPTGDTWLSLGDAARLSEVICPDDWKASAGLFLAPQKAWIAISEFCRSGARSLDVEWIRPADMPDDGNW